MVAHEVIGGGVAQRIIELGRALQIGEHDGNPADLGIVAGTKQLLRAEPTEGGHGNHALAGQRVLGPVAILDDERSGRSLSLRIASSSLPLAPLKQNVGAARYERWDDAVGADVAIGFRAGLDGPKTVWARSQG